MSDAIDIAKRRYSSELAAYTFEQWRIAHQKMQTSSEGDDASEADAHAPPEEDRQRNEERGRRSRPVSSLLSADLNKPLPAINGTA